MSTFTIEIDDHGLARDLAAASNDLEMVIDQATDDAREPLGRAFWAVTHVVSGDLRDANEFIAGPGFQLTHVNFMPYASFENDLHHFQDRGVERAERDVLRIYDQAVGEFAETFGGDDGE